MEVTKPLYPSFDEAHTILSWAKKQNPGAWVEHSKNVARSASVIAEKCQMNSTRAYVSGLLHDIGRFEGQRDLHHAIAGHTFMQNKGFHSVARICLTHSFPIKNIGSYVGKVDCTKEEIDYIAARLKSMEYDDYDNLIQLCDAISSSKGICLIETRVVDVAKRRGVNPHSIEKWQVFDSLKDYFSKKCGCSVYSLFKDEICNSIF